MESEIQSITPRFGLLRSRCEMDWGEAPKYNEAYRKLRWPAAPVVHATTQDELEERADRQARRAQRGMTGTLEDYESPVILRDYYPKPMWKALMQGDLAKKRNGEWTHKFIRIKLKSDLVTCLSNNIPFKTKTFEYKPIDQWIYVNGIRALRYDLRTGYLVDFTYSGVYNKRTSLLFRMFGIYVKLIKQKPTYSVHAPRSRTRLENEATGREVVLDVNRMYNFRDVNPNLEKGFYLIDYRLDRESNALFQF